MGGVLHNSQILSMAILLRAWTGAAAASAACAAAPGEAMALRPTARHKKAANNKADSNKSARKGAPAQSAQSFLQKHHRNHPAAVVVDTNMQAPAVTPKQESQAVQRFDNSAVIPAAQPGVQEGKAALSTYDMIEAVAVDHPGIGLLQQEILSNDGDEFYVGCMLDPRVAGVERMDALPAGLSDLDGSAFFLRLGNRWVLFR